MMTTGNVSGQTNDQAAEFEATKNVAAPATEHTDPRESDPQMTRKTMAATMRSTEAPSRPDQMTDLEELKTEEKIVKAEDTTIYSLGFSETTMSRLEGYDTLVRIQTADLKALDSNMDIEKKLDNGTNVNCANLDDTRQ